MQFLGSAVAYQLCFVVNVALNWNVTRASMYSVVCFLLFKQPPSLPTSKNYPEMRERLRLRLKKKVRHLFCADF